MFLCFLILGFWRYTRGLILNSYQEQAITMLLNIVVIQFLLGMFTIILVVPTWLAIMHQVGATLLLIAFVYTYFLVNYSEKK